MKKIWFPGLLLVLLWPFLFGCCASKKLRTEIKEVTITKIDTVIKIKTDTVTKIKEVFYIDTAKIENDYSIAKSYLDTVHKKLVLTLTGKNFSVPIKIDQIKESNIKKSETEKKILPGTIFFIVIVISFILGVIMTCSFLLKKYFK